MLDGKQRAKIIEEYQNNEASIVEIAARHSIYTADIYSILRSAGIPRNRKRGPRPAAPLHIIHDNEFHAYKVTGKAEVLIYATSIKDVVRIAEEMPFGIHWATMEIQQVELVKDYDDVVCEGQT